jgi:glycerophosphoryl diester phosphodiesterase
MRPLVIAHRGASAHEPENTLAAFERAVTFGADGVELDVRATADGALAVHHDPNLADGRPIGELRAAELPPSVCLLDAALAACGDLLVNVEIKADGPGGGTALAAPVAATCRAWGGRVLVSSFDPATVDAIRAVAPELPTAQLTFVLERSVATSVAWMAGRGHTAWHPHHASLDAAAVAGAHEAGLSVHPWTVDDPARITELARWGVDGIVTNDVPVAQAARGSTG